MKIVIDGMDGAGKSTVAKALAEKIGAKYVDGLLLGYLRSEGFSENDLKVIRKAIDACSDNEISIIRTWLYGFANIFNLLHYDCDLVIDRHCLTTYYYNGDAESQRIFTFMQELAGKPDYIFLLRASTETRRARLNARNIFDPDLHCEMKMAYGYDKMETAAKSLNLDYTIIDTDNQTVDQIVNAIIQIIKG